MTSYLPQPRYQLPWEKEFWAECSELVKRISRRKKTGQPPMPNEHIAEETAAIALRYHRKYTVFKPWKLRYDNSAPTLREGESQPEYAARVAAYDRLLKNMAEWNKNLPSEIARWTKLADAYELRMQGAEEREAIQQEAATPTEGDDGIPF